MQVKAQLNNLRIAPRKVRLSADLIRGLELFEALDQIETIVRGCNEQLRKLLLSALANAENNFGLDKNNLKIASIIVNEGPVLKRWRPRAFGRAATILKRTSKVELILEEIEEGKNRKTKEQLEKEKKARLAAQKKAEKEAQNSKQEKEEILDNDSSVKKGVEKAEKKPDTKKGKWSKKIFRRKSI
jgi:large subunit ribosomal protein L22